MKLPSVYANKIDKEIKNNAEFYKREISEKNRDLSMLKSCFDSMLINLMLK